ncbi:MAG: translocation/assembly module TamB [Firmicutes bacterium]|jgi:hypothetical protein|nr:translocation/assembly module TamB [Bacillota bacterium]
MKRAAIAVLGICVLLALAVALSNDVLIDLGRGFVEAELGRVLGVSEVRVGGVTASGLRSVTLSDISAGHGIRLDRLTLEYRFRDLLSKRTRGLASITRVVASGVRVDWGIAAGELFSGTQDSPAERREDFHSLREANRFSGTLTVHDAAIVVPAPEGGGMVTLADLRAAPSLRESRSSVRDWAISARFLEYARAGSEDLGVRELIHRAVDLALTDLTAVLSLDTSTYTLEVRDLDGQVLGGRVAGSVSVTPHGSGYGAHGELRLFGIDLGGSEVDSAEATFDAREDRVVLSSVRFTAAGVEAAGEITVGPGGAVEASGLLQRGAQVDVSLNPDGGKAWRVGFVFSGSGGRGEAGTILEGELQVTSAELGSVVFPDTALGLTARLAPTGLEVDLQGDGYGLEALSAGLGAPGMVSGWVDWSARLRFQPREDRCAGLESSIRARLEIAGGTIRAALWPQEVTDLSGEIDVGEDGVTVRSLAGNIGGGQITLIGPLRRLTILAQNVRLHHQFIHGTADARLDLAGVTAPGGDRLRVAGSVDLRHSQVDVTALAASGGGALPDMDIDLDVSIGEGVRLVGDGFWASMRPGQVKLAGAMSKPQVTGTVEVDEGEVTVYGAPFELVQGWVDFPEDSGVRPELHFVARDHTTGSDITATVSGTPGGPGGRMRISLESDPPMREDDIMMKLMEARMRLFLVDSLGRVIESISDSDITPSPSRETVRKETSTGSRIEIPTIYPKL